jgi:hypothetical protein
MHDEYLIRSTGKWTEVMKQRITDVVTSQTELKYQIHDPLPIVFKLH